MIKLLIFSLFLLIGCGGPDYKQDSSPQVTELSFVTTSFVERFIVTWELWDYVFYETSNTCVQWATSQTLVDLGLVENLPVTPEFYEEIRVAMQQDPLKGTYYDPHLAYLNSIGLNMYVFRIDSCIDYGQLAAAIESGCSASVGMYTESEGHFETILQILFDANLQNLDTSASEFYDVNSCSMRTNSWGQTATVEGFFKNQYHHTNMHMYNTPNTEVYGYVICKEIKE